VPLDDRERRMRGARGQRQAPQMIEHDARRQPLEQRLVLNDLRGGPVQLHVPAKFVDAARQRLDHAEVDHRLFRRVQRETDPADAAVVQRLQLRVGHVGPQHADAARMFAAKPGDRIERNAVVDVVKAWRDDHRTAGADALLETFAVIVGTCVRNEFARRTRAHEARIVYVHMRVARQLARERGPSSGCGHSSSPDRYVVCA
jgi:hypothetical protein